MACLHLDDTVECAWGGHSLNTVISAAVESPNIQVDLVRLLLRTWAETPLGARQLAAEQALIGDPAGKGQGIYMNDSKGQLTQRNSI